MKFQATINYLLSDENFREAACAAESRFGDAEYNIHSCGLTNIEELLEEARGEANEVAFTFEELAREWAAEGLPSQEKYEYKVSLANLAVSRIYNAAFASLEVLCEEISRGETNN